MKNLGKIGLKVARDSLIVGGLFYLLGDLEITHNTLDGVYEQMADSARYFEHTAQDFYLNAREGLVSATKNLIILAGGLSLFWHAAPDVNFDLLDVLRPADMR